MDRDLAEFVSDTLQDCTMRANKSLEEIDLAGAPEIGANMYRRIVGNLLGYMYTELLAPLWQEHPDLEPTAEAGASGAYNPDNYRLPLAAAQAILNTMSSIETRLGEVRSKLPASDPLLNELQYLFEQVEAAKRLVRRHHPDLQV